MAKEEVGLKLEVEFESVGALRKALKQATNDLLVMQQQFGKTSPQAIEAAKRVAELKDQIQDAKEQADLFDPGKKFSALTAAASKIAAGFSAVQGAMALVGVESEDLQKQLLKVQGAIALSQGLSELADLGEAYDKVKTTAVTAFKAIRTAIGSTGIGLLVIALGTIVAYWDDIKAAISGVSEEQKKLNAEAAKRAESSKKDLDNLSLQENSLKLQGKTEREILKIRVEKTKQAIEAQIRNIKALQTTNEIQEKTAARNKEILQGILTFISTPIAALLKGVDLIGEAVGKNFDLYNKFYGTISSLVFDPEKERAQGAKTIEEQNKVLMELQSDLDGHNLAIRNIDKAAADKSAADQEKINADKLKKQQEADKVLLEARKSILNEQQKEEEAALDKLNESKKILLAAGNKDFTLIELVYQEELINIRKKYRDKEAENEKKAREEKLRKDTEAQQKDIANKTAAFEKIRQVTQNSITNQQKQEEERRQLLSDTINSFQSATQSISDLFRVSYSNELSALDEQRQLRIQKAGDNKEAVLAIEQETAIQRQKILDKQFKMDKTMAIVEATINTFKAASQVFARPAPGTPVTSLAIKITSMVAAIAQGIANVARIRKVQAPGISSGGDVAGGGGAPMAAVASPAVMAQSLNAQAINQLGNQSMRAYVLNSDITNNEQRNAYLQRNARLG